MRSYAIWNNKGGVGKTFLTYILSTEYAIKNPEKTICVVDMCPQSNISQLILGGNGKGIENHKKFRDNKKTIADYIKQRFDRSRSSRTGSEISFFEQAKRYNTALPDNMYILAGSNQLDLCANLINYMAGAPEKNAWQQSRLLLKDILSVFVDKEETDSKREVVCFIDCNPSFSAYTELAMLAADRLIVPCTADAASSEAVDSLFRLIYGVGGEENDSFLNFYHSVSEKQMDLPKIHLTILNKSRSYEANPSKAFKVYAEDISEKVKQIKTANPNRFTNSIDYLLYNVKDGNTLVPVLSYEGNVLSSIKSGSRNINDELTQLNVDQITAFKNDIDPIINVL